MIDSLFLQNTSIHSIWIHFATPTFWKESSSEKMKIRFFVEKKRRGSSLETKFFIILDTDCYCRYSDTFLCCAYIFWWKPKNLAELWNSREYKKALRHHVKKGYSWIHRLNRLQKIKLEWKDCNWGVYLTCQTCSQGSLPYKL